MTSIESRSDVSASLVRAMISGSHIPLLLFNADQRVVAASRSFCATFDIAQDRTTGRSLEELGHGEWAIPQLRLLIENALLDGPELGDYETDLAQKNGGPRRLVVSVQPLVHEDAPNARALMVINDVTQARRVENLKAALLIEKDAMLRERQILLEEMQHRVANSLQIIASVLVLKARAVKSDESRAHLQDAHDRVMSVAAVQQHLQTSVGEVEIGTYLTKLCGSLGDSMISGSREVSLEVRAETATVSSQRAVSLGLIVTELVINSLKHAFPEGRAGRIVVAYGHENEGWTLSVTDDGIGRKAAMPGVRAGLGTSVVEALARQLGGRVLISDAAPGARVAVVGIQAQAPEEPGQLPAAA
ncbi:MAG TPA: histidine kinase dimerization/phosphoacceptor domain -containing protein [Phenylobacterium sp.]|nr:histidine kinase dimerization/phosphoacceptor domain -containing protein [Phenylobacterium sp.]